MSSLVNCTHRACKECLRAHFTSLIHDRSVFTLLCPICHKPDITDQNIQEYFTHLDMTVSFVTIHNSTVITNYIKNEIRLSNRQISL